jgi:hypothetical protein
VQAISTCQFSGEKMLYKKNLSNTHRYARVAFGLAGATAAVLLVDGALSAVLAFASLLGAASGIVGFCPMCALAGWRLRRSSK